MSRLDPESLRDVDAESPLATARNLLAEAEALLREAARGELSRDDAATTAAKIRAWATVDGCDRPGF